MAKFGTKKKFLVHNLLEHVLSAVWPFGTQQFVASGLPQCFLNASNFCYYPNVRGSKIVLLPGL